MKALLFLMVSLCVILTANLSIAGNDGINSIVCSHNFNSGLIPKPFDLSDGSVAYELKENGSILFRGYDGGLVTAKVTVSSKTVRLSFPEYEILLKDSIANLDHDSIIAATINYLACGGDQDCFHPMSCMILQGKKIVIVHAEDKSRLLAQALKECDSSNVVPVGSLRDWSQGGIRGYSDFAQAFSCQ